MFFLMQWYCDSSSSRVWVAVGEVKSGFSFCSLFAVTSGQDGKKSHLRLSRATESLAFMCAPYQWHIRRVSWMLQFPH